MQQKPLGGTCKVIETGVGEDGSILIRMADLSNQTLLRGKKIWFTALPNKQREMLDIALTAISFRRVVEMLVDKTIDQILGPNFSEEAPQANVVRLYVSIDDIV